MTYRVAMAISGAVSLGSYEAGCVYELLNAFKEHNANPQNTPIEIYWRKCRRYDSGNDSAKAVVR